MALHNTNNLRAWAFTSLAGSAVRRGLLLAVLCCGFVGLACCVPIPTWAQSRNDYDEDDFDEDDYQPSTSQKGNVPLAENTPEVSDYEADSSGRDALKSLKKAPWYDAEADALKSIDPPKIAEDKGNRGTWEGKLDDPAPKNTTTTTTSTWNFSFWEVLAWLFRGLIYVAIAALFIAIGVILFRYFNLASYFDDGSEGEPELDEKLPDTPADRIEELPFDVRTVRGNLLDEARECYERGDFNRAVVYLYGYELVQLDKRQQIELAKGKTNRQYLWELRSRRDMKDLIEPTVVAFEDAFFGEHNLDRPRFEALWNRVDRFHQLLEQPT
jgi:hypothetical protein